MAGLTQRKTSAIGSTDSNSSNNNKNNNSNIVGSSYSNGDNDNKDLHHTNGTTSVMDSNKTTTSIPTAANSKGKSLKERSTIPYSFYVTFGTIIGLQYFGGLYDTTATVRSWYSSLYQSIITLLQLVQYSRTILLSPPSSSTTTTASSTTTWKEFIFVLTLWGVVILPLIYVFFIAPFRAGFWTGRKSSRHMFHRYMGLCYLLHYVLAWIEFFTNPASSKTSYLCHIIAVMGVLQGSSAYFSFKVLPELNDPGYYSDKAVLSRTFVQENIFFTVMAVFGSIYYNETARTTLRSNWGGRIIEALYVFWPFVAIRPWYPITRFSNAGQTYNGRSVKNQYFYEVATMMVKFFYLWAKYFLGFFINFMVYLNLVKEENWSLINGMLLLNAGTVSLSIFLHTLRFKKVLPAKLTMSIYLGQIYLTFMAVPTILRMFQDHPKLCGLCLIGLMGNATRNRKIHAVWCGIAMILLTQTEIDW